MDIKLLSLRITEVIVVTCVLLAHAQADTSSPCRGCRLFNPERQTSRESGEPGFTQCRYPCQCPEGPLECQAGVNVVHDGCGCCLMCARQLGDMCSTRDVCDKDKDLYCSAKGDNSTGTCLGKQKKPCRVKGALYRDGEKFYNGCARLCTCQNGFHGCVDLCPQERNKPSESTCHKPKLIKVKSKCCREWTCQKLDTSGQQPLSSDKGLESQSLILKNPMWYRTSTLKPTNTTTTTPTQVQGERTCNTVKSDWSPCSVTCGVGVSMRRVVDKTTCHSHQERQLCYFRPCGVKVTTLGRTKCTPTTRTSGKQHIRFQDCLSVRPYKPKFCTNCREGMCCYPKSFRIKTMEFQCTGGTKEVLNYMWIKKCRCTKECFTKKSKGWKKRRRRYRNKRKRKERKKKKWRRRYLRKKQRKARKG